ncbi:hypothetical protein TIFTF001_027964 [Ficus carica]|uniref:BHLH domain-containing protein n=1 Tax=Ficus carica TaxID=3494 RepID=A0AA88J101_FICCA|nr:hypothetical protein TIFTF001_027964 [Ficus carica]
MALSFISNIWNSPPSLQHINPNPDLVSFQQRKKPRFSNLSFSNPNLSFPNSYTTPSPTSFHPHPNPLILQNDNSSFSHHNNFSTSTTNSHFFSPYPYDNLFSDQFFDGCPSNPDLVSELLTDEDRILLAPLLSDQPQVCEFPVPQDFNYDRQEINAEVKKPISSSSSSSTAVSPQSIAARERRRKITEKTQELGKLIPGGNKMSTAEMFQAAYKYVKFLQAQISILQSVGSSIREMKEEPVHIKELQVLASSVVQQKLYSEEKCLVPKQFVDRTLANRPELNHSTLF